MSLSRDLLSDAYEQRLRGSSVATSCTLDDDNDDESYETNNVEIIDLTVLEDCSMEDDIAEIQGQYDNDMKRDIRVGDFLQVKNTVMDSYPVDFILVKHINHRFMTAAKYRGIPFTRSRNLLGQLPKKLNEVCMMLQYRQRDSWVPDKSPLMVDVKERNVVRRRHIIMTNAPYPEYSGQPQWVTGQRITGRADRDHQRLKIKTYGNVICRWKLTLKYAKGRRMPKVDEEAIERLSPKDSRQSQHFMSDEILCNRWRGGRIRGGSWTPDLASKAHHIDVDQDSAGLIHRRRAKGQKYTVFDAFCGAGGVACGAQSAGFRVSHAVDKAPDVWETYKLNFPHTHLYKMSVDKFILQLPNSGIQVDVLHMSPPCQYFSPAHTRPSAHDDDNMFAQFSCAELVRRLQPRLVTIEQTFGITHKRHRSYFRSIVGDMTHLGYSVRWRVVELCTWGSPQTRKRLIIIAAAPGEKLPPFPPATHSESGGNSLRPFSTIRHALRRIQEGDDIHNVASVRRFDRRRPRLDIDSMIGTVLTGGGDFYHPDGERHYTAREYACLQGFPVSYAFRGTMTQIKRQIGNAFPPNCVKVLYKHLERWLLKQDGMTDGHSGGENVLVLDEMSSTRQAAFDRSDIMDWEGVGGVRTLSLTPIIDLTQYTD